MILIRGNFGDRINVNDMLLTLVWGCGLVWLVMGLDETLHNPMRN